MTTDAHSDREIFLEFLERNFMIERDEFDHEESLVDQGVIDSLGLIEISTFLEKKFCFKVTEEMMTRDNFGSVVKIVHFIQRNK